MAPVAQQNPGATATDGVLNATTKEFSEMPITYQKHSVHDSSLVTWHSSLLYVPTSTQKGGFMSKHRHKSDVYDAHPTQKGLL